MPKFERTCNDCGADYTAGASNSIRCKDCAITAVNSRRRVTNPSSVVCGICGSTYEQKRRDQKFCSQECSYEAHKKANRKPEIADARDEQMEKLFRYYKSKENITIDSRPEGTRVVSLSDFQLPFIDEPLTDAIVEFISDYKPHDIILNGDILDCYEVSDFDKRPERLFHLGTEFEMAGDLIRRLKRYAAKDVQVWWVDGNHEERLQRAIWRRAQDFSFLVKDIPEAVGLDNLCAGYVPYGKLNLFTGKFREPKLIIEICLLNYLQSLNIELTFAVSICLFLKNLRSRFRFQA